MKPLKQSIRIDRNVEMEMRDGTILRADIYRPEGHEKYPAILIRTPYGKHAFNGGFLNPVEAALAGFAIIIQDIRGRFASQGQWDRQNMFEVEALDGYDSVEWIAAQSWSNGSVGMAGGSYLAALTWIAAMARPPHLKAISPWIGDIGTHMQPFPHSGVINFYTAANAIPLTALDLLDKLEQSGEDVQNIRAYIEHVLEHPEEVIHHLPLKEIPLAKYEPIKKMWLARLNPLPAQEQDKYRKYELVNVPALHVGGWFDQLEWATIRNYQQMVERGGSPYARDHQYLLMGPWMHGAPVNYLGEMGFGSAVGGRGIDIHQKILSFFVKHLCDIEITIPSVRYFVMGENKWKEADHWPPPDTQWQHFYLHSGGRANTAQGDGKLSREMPGSQPPDTFIYDPINPVPTLGGRVVPSPGLVPGPFDQSSIEMRNDVLCYTSDVLQEDLEVSGPVVLKLYASTSAVDTDFTAKLVDVQPNGRALNIAEGIQRASFREWNGSKSPVKPGEIYLFTIYLGNTSYLFRRGHRIRLEVSSSNFPLYDRNMNTGNPIGEDAVGQKAEQTIYHDGKFASHLVLPVIPRQR